MNPTVAGALKSKTVWANTIAAAVEAANFVTPFIPPQYHVYGVVALGVLNIILRAVTTQSLAEK